ALTLANEAAALGIRLRPSVADGAIPSSVTVTKSCADRYFVFILVVEDIKELDPVEQSVGADLGLKEFVILSTGEMVGNPKFFHKDEKQLAKAQRRHAKKRKGSKNRAKARVKVAKIHARIADRR